MPHRTVIETKTHQEVLLRYALGAGARAKVLTGNIEYPADRIVEIWVPLDETFIKHGQRFYRLICGHGDWEDIPIDG